MRISTQSRLSKDSPRDRQPVAPSQGEVIEVSVAWRGGVLGLVSLGKRKALFPGETTGRGEHCDLFLPEEVLGSRRHQLMQVDARGAVHLFPPSVAEGWVRSADEMQVDLASLCAGGSVCEGRHARRILVPQHER